VIVDNERPILVDGVKAFVVCGFAVAAA